MLDPTDLAKVAASLPPGLLEQVYKDLLQPGAQQAGKAIGTVLGLANTALVPLEWLNERRRIWLAHHLDSYRQKMEHVSEDDVIPVRPEIGVPIVERLSYYTDETLSELFVNLLVTASDENTVQLAHPSFVRVIEHLSPDEARLLLRFKESQYLTYVAISLLREESFEVPVTDPYYLGSWASSTLDFPQNIGIYDANLRGLALLEPMEHRDPPDRDGVKEVWERAQALLRELGLDPADRHMPYCWGFMMITPYGRMFLDACTKDMA